MIVADRVNVGQDLGERSILGRNCGLRGTVGQGDICGKLLGFLSRLKDGRHRGRRVKEFKFRHRVVESLNKK